MDFLLEMLIRALAIEDDPDFAKLVKHWLARHEKSVQFELHIEDTLAGALSFLAKVSVDLIFLDLGLSDSNGPATLQQLLGESPGTAVIVLSGEDSDRVVSQVIYDGAEDHIVRGEDTKRNFKHAKRLADHL